MSFDSPKLGEWRIEQTACVFPLGGHNLEFLSQYVMSVVIYKMVFLTNSKFDQREYDSYSKFIHEL